MSTKTVNISFQDSLLADIDKIAQSESRSRSELLREAARMYIERKKRWNKIFAYSAARLAQNNLTAADVHAEIEAHRRTKKQSKKADIIDGSQQ